MIHRTHASYTDGMAFDVEIEGHHFSIDAAEEFGGQGRGPKPKGLVLSSLAGCTGMDVVSILKKMRMPFDSFDVAVAGELTDEHPKVYHSIQLTYRFTGDALDRDKIERAVELSQQRYCGVTAMLSKTAKITYSIELNP